MRHVLAARLLSAFLVTACGLATAPARADDISGTYLEARTCQVYTGPCFANAEVNLTGKDGMMAWKIAEGKHAGIDLAGLSVVVVVSGSDTLGFGGVDDPKEIKSSILVDEKATVSQRDALVAFAKEHAGRAGQHVIRVDSAPITMSLDTATLAGKLEAGKNVKLSTRKARKGDCICQNETAYYPPLAHITHFVPGVALQGECSGKGLSSQWSIPESRSAYMGTFEYE